MTGTVKYPAAELRGIRPSRHSPNIRASAAAWLIARGNKIFRLFRNGKVM